MTRVIFVLSSRTRFNRVFPFHIHEARCRTSCSYFLPFVALLINPHVVAATQGNLKNDTLFDEIDNRPMGERKKLPITGSEANARNPPSLLCFFSLSFFLSSFLFFFPQIEKSCSPRGVSRVTRDKTRVSTSKARPPPFLRHVTGKL